MMGDRVLLSIKPIEDEKQLNISDVMNVNKFMKQIENNQRKSTSIDKISVTLDDFKENDYRLDDIVSVNITKGK